MSTQTIVCDLCGTEYGIGQSPWCRDGHGFGTGGYDAFTPVTDDMIAPEPVTFGNRGERSRFMDRNAIVPKNVSSLRPGRAVYFDCKGK